MATLIVKVGPNTKEPLNTLKGILNTTLRTTMDVYQWSKTPEGFKIEDRNVDILLSQGAQLEKAGFSVEIKE